MAISVSTDVPFGNAVGVRVTERGDRTDVEFSPGAHGGPECLWFCFRIVADGPVPAAVRVVLDNPHTVLGGSRPETFRPVVRYEGGDWERIACASVDTLPDGRARASWQVAAPRSWADVAFCYPYGMGEVDELVSSAGGALHVDTIGRSQLGRPIVRLASDYGAPSSTRAGVYLVGRQHAGETPGSWVMDGFVREFLRRGAGAPQLWAVPLANVDGVEQGDYGKDNYPYDLNRAWGAPAMRHETQVIMSDVARWQARCAPALAIDFHAPGGSESAGVYCFVPDAASAPEQAAAVAPWAAAIQRSLAPDVACEPFCRVARYPSRWETARFTQFCWARGIPALTIETPYATANGVLLTRDLYRQIGARVAGAVVGCTAR